MPRYNVIFEHIEADYWAAKVDADTPEDARQKAWNDYINGVSPVMTPAEDISSDYADHDDFHIISVEEVDKINKE